MLSSTLQEFAGAEVDFERLALLGGQVREAAIEHGLCGRDELDDDRIVLRKRIVDRRQQARQLHRQQQLREEPLLGAFEDRQRRGFGSGIQGAAAFRIDDPGGLERFAKVAVDDRLSRGGDNAKERGVGAQFP
jgi:hypothetical protein